jgi:hypothetical protein
MLLHVRRVLPITAVAAASLLATTGSAAAASWTVTHTVAIDGFA